MSNEKLGPVALSYLEKRLLPQGSNWLIPGTDRTERSKKAAVAALVEEAGKKDASPRVKSVLATAQMAQKAIDLNEQGLDHLSIADEVSANITLVGDLIRWANEPGIAWSSEEELAKKVVALRKDGVSWSGIAIRAGVTKGVVQRLFKEAGGGDPHKSDIGKGGRRKDTYHTGVAEKPKPKPKAKKATKPKPKATKSKAAPKKAPNTEDAPF